MTVQWSVGSLNRGLTTNLRPLHFNELADQLGVLSCLSPEKKQSLRQMNQLLGSGNPSQLQQISQASCLGNCRRYRRQVQDFSFSCS